MGIKKPAIKVYHGFGHTHDMVLFGHVFKKHVPQYDRHSGNALTNLWRMFRLFLVKPLPNIPLEVTWGDQQISVKTEYDGFFRAEWTAKNETTAGWHVVNVMTPGTSKLAADSGVGKMYIPHSTQYAYISDIDDTVLVSHSATKKKRLQELLFKNPHSRIVFPGVVQHYQLLANAHTNPGEQNPFFYVSSSEWNLYDYIRDVFTYQHLPDGAFLLNQVKRWYELWKTGKTKHEGKLLRILRILEVFPKQRFILFGDNSQSDPGIYNSLTEKYGHRIFAVYIRNIVPANEAITTKFLEAIGARGVHTCLFNHSNEAEAHSRKIGLID